MATENEPFANPQPPPDYQIDKESNSIHPLTNDDFRKLLMTPANTTSRIDAALQSKAKDPDAAERRRLRKMHYAKLMREEKMREDAITKKYRDRAKERRENAKDQEDLTISSNYRAVAPDSKTTVDTATRRKQLIEESKFLGGDISHTHLVKGLDYALLQKIRAEIASKETANTEESKKLAEETNESPEADNELHFKTKLARNIYRILFQSKPAKSNDLFLPRRLAYVVDLDDDYFDIPTTLIRSKAECPNLETSTTLTNNDIVIQKLTEILSYLRHGKRENKKAKKKPTKEEEGRKGVPPGPSIYDDIGDNRSRNKNITLYEKERKESGRKNYFGNDNEINDEISSSALVHNVKQAIANIDDKLVSKLESSLNDSKKSKIQLPNMDSYAECYPGTAAEEDVNIDSDDEPDYNKMDLGNKKGPVGRWDFDTQEEYSDYMSQREAMPKAAFQYGVKMADGRKTRRLAGSFDEKRKLDREWQQISKIIEKRKATGAPGDFASVEYDYSKRLKN